MIQDTDILKKLNALTEIGVLEESDGKYGISEFGVSIAFQELLVDKKNETGCKNFKVLLDTLIDEGMIKEEGKNCVLTDKGYKEFQDRWTSKGVNMMIYEKMKKKEQEK